jgi:hypothetical protein
MPCGMYIELPMLASDALQTLYKPCWTCATAIWHCWNLQRWTSAADAALWDSAVGGVPAAASRFGRSVAARQCYKRSLPGGEVAAPEVLSFHR